MKTKYLGLMFAALMSVSSLFAQNSYGVIKKVNPDSVSVSIGSMHAFTDSLCNKKETQYFKRTATLLYGYDRMKWNFGREIGSIYFYKPFYVMDTRVPIDDSSLIVHSFCEEKVCDWWDVGDGYVPRKPDILSSSYIGEYSVFLYFKKKHGMYILRGASLSRPGSKILFQSKDQKYYYFYRFRHGKNCNNKVLFVAIDEFVHEFNLEQKFLE